MDYKKIKFHMRDDKMLRLISFTYDMLRAVKMGDAEELSKEQHAELLDIEDTLSKLYKQATGK